jgi:hypothetical protein
VKTSFDLPDDILLRLGALADRDAPYRPNKTATLCRIILEAHRSAGLPDPGTPVAGVPPTKTKRTAGGKR